MLSELTPTGSNVLVQSTTFARDVVSRYVCNTLGEARDSTRKDLPGNPRADARQFDVIIIGGGTFGAALAEHLMFRDKAHASRILVLEAGPFALPEHTQNLPMVGLGVPDKIKLADLWARSPAEQEKWRKEVWGLPWHSATEFPGLAYCLGGRSLYWGGWSPEPLDPDELAGWPPAVVAELKARYFQEASVQLGVTETNDFIFGALHTALRAHVKKALASVPSAMSLSTLPDHPAVRYLNPGATLGELADLLGVPPASLPAGVTRAELLDELKLEAPLAVQGRPPRAGFFPMNKFNSMALLMKAAREAEAEAGGDNFFKRLMIVPNCHVRRVSIDGSGRVVGVSTNQGDVELRRAGKVVLALGTIESTRLALASIPSSPPPPPGWFLGSNPSYARDYSAWRDLIGKNLIAHLRTNFTIRVPRSRLAGIPASLKELQTSALFVKGEVQPTSGPRRHFHLQVTASGLGPAGTDAEAEMWKKVPDLDSLEAMKKADDQSVVITIRAIGEMEPLDLANAAAHNSSVRQDPQPDEHGVPRAFVTIQQSQLDEEVWTKMDQACLDLAKAIDASHVVVSPLTRDTLGTTHHEAGTLFMGTNPKTSVTDADGRFHHLQDAGGALYAVGPSVCPSTGSPNPMLSGIALARRLGDRLAAPLPTAPSDGSSLFDGASLAPWRMSTIRNQPGRDNPGRFVVVDGALMTVTGNDLGMLWCTTPLPVDFRLKLEFARYSDDANSGVFLRFPAPTTQGYDNNAFVPVDLGFEVQLDERGFNPKTNQTGDALHQTGAIYGFAGSSRIAGTALGVWNRLEIDVRGDDYQVFLNDLVTPVTSYKNVDPKRAVRAPSFVGLQTHTGRVAFRNIRFAP